MLCFRHLSAGSLERAFRNDVDIFNVQVEEGVNNGPLVNHGPGGRGSAGAGQYAQTLNKIVVIFFLFIEKLLGKYHDI